MSAPVATLIEAPGPAGPLQGTMLAPASANWPMVLIVPGSGPTDRDGNGAGGLAAATYRLLAEGLLARGIASARIDKRGLFGSRAAVPDANAVTIADYAQDIHTWIATIRARTGVSCVWLLGHSEGGLVALAAAQRPDLCGLILVATAGRKLGDVLRDQLRTSPADAPIVDDALRILSMLEAGQCVPEAQIDPALWPLFHPAVQGYLMSALSLDPASLMAGVRLATLIVQGRRDIQVDVDDARRLKAANPAATLLLLPNVNHVLKTVTSDERAANLATYASPDLPLAAGVVDGIADFIGEHAR